MGDKATIPCVERDDNTMKELEQIRQDYLARQMEDRMHPDAVEQTKREFRSLVQMASRDN